MGERELLHRLIDAMADDELREARAVMARIIASSSERAAAYAAFQGPTSSEVIQALESVPFDDEPATDEDRMALKEAREASNALISGVPADAENVKT